MRVRIAWGGICGSDLHYYHDGANGAFVVREPLTPGHELSGTVDLDPSGELKPGAPVTFHPATFGDCQPGLEGQPHLWPNGDYLGSASTTPLTDWQQKLLSAGRERPGSPRSLQFVQARQRTEGQAVSADFYRPLA